MARHMALALQPEGMTTPAVLPMDYVPTRAFDLARGNRTPLTVIAAPAGYGKTSLLQALAVDAANCGHATEWRALENCALEETGAATPAVIFVDDAHVGDPRRFERFIHAIVAGSGRGSASRYVVATRMLPEMDWLGLEARGFVRLLRLEDLTLNEEEAARLLSHYAGTDSPSHETLIAAQRWTEGWPIAVQLCGLVARRRSHLPRDVIEGAGTSGDLFRYLGEALYIELDEPMQRFLLAISDLEHFSFAMIAALMGPPGASLLARAAAENLMVVPVASRPGWLRLHGVFRSFLQGCKTRSGMKVDGGHLRSAAAWSLAEGHVADGIEYLLRAGLAADAQRELLRNAQRLIQEEGEIVRLLIWSNEIERSLGTLSAPLRLWRCWGLSLSLELDQAETELALANADIPADAPAENLAHRDRLYISLAAQAGRFDEVIARSERWLADWGEAKPFHAAAVTALKALSYYWLGEPAASRREIAIARRLARGTGRNFAHLWVAVIDTILELEAGRATRARAVIETELANLEGRGPVARSMETLMQSVAARVILETGDVDEASRRLALGQPGFYRHGIVETCFAALEAAVLIAAESGGIDLALAELRLSEVPGERFAALSAMRAVQMLIGAGRVDEAGAAFDAELGLLGTSLDRDVLLAGLTLARGQAASALAMCDRLIAACESAGRGRLLIAALLIAAGGRDAEGDMGAARRYWRRAIRLAADGGLQQTAVENAWAVAALLRSAEAMEALTPAEAAICARMRIHAGIDLAVAAIIEVEQLTPREAEVLRLLDSGLTSERLAQRMELGPSTARWHMRNIYAKLGVHNRSGAIARARQLALI